MTFDAGPDAGIAMCPEGEHLARTRQGCVRGAAAGNVEVFKGLPYAAPPVGTLRWRPPAPAPVHEGVQDALEFGLSCPQGPDSFSGEVREWSEDCLTLNVWTPNIGAGGDSALPVMVWFHPGGMYEGGSDNWTYDGRHLAELGNVIVVTINYRLGQLGYLAHPALSDESPSGMSGNYGLLDQIAALTWVRENIELFGGNAENVTLFGVSGGGISVCALLASPLTEGLFHRAIIQSAICPDYGSFVRDLKDGNELAPESAEEQGERFADELGCTTGDVLDCMRSKSPNEVLDALGSTGILRAEQFGLTIDGRVLEESVRTTLLEGRGHDVPVIAGTTADEGTAFVAGANPTVEQYEAQIRATYGEHAEEILDLYPASDFPSPHYALASLTGDEQLLCPNRDLVRHLVEHNPSTYSYVFGQITVLGAALGLGAYHGADMEFEFGSLRLRPTEPAASGAELAISNAMVAYWSNFARTGDPNGTGTVAWPRSNTDTGPYLFIGTPIEARDRLKPEKCALLDELR